MDIKGIAGSVFPKGIIESASVMKVGSEKEAKITPSAMNPEDSGISKSIRMKSEVLKKGIMFDQKA